MDAAEFRVRGKEMVDYICDYMENIKDKRVTANVEPGYLKDLLPTKAPQEPEDWAQIMSDVEDKIMPGITHWQHPRFHAYFPSGNSFPSILGDMLSDAIGCIGFSWAASPACTELETIVMDWFGQAIGLPDDFITSSKTSKGGGVIQSSASECVLVSMLAARNQAILHLKQARKHRQSTSKEVDKNKTCNGNCSLPEFDEVDFKSNKLDNKYKECSEDDCQEEEQDYYENDSAYLPQLIAYCSKESHSCVEKAAMILLVKLRILDVDENCSLRGHTLEKAMREDKARGLTPFFVSTTLGSTGCCSFDNLPEIGPICKAEPCTWFHVDAAYAGNAFICPELRPLMAGIEYADSFNTNPNKWLLVNFDCSCMWVKDRFRLTKALVVDPLYLQHANSSEAIDYRHWGIPLSRRFRSLKLWFVIRSYGLEGLQAYIRNHIRLAKLFEGLVRKDPRFEVVNDVRLGLVCFRLNGPDAFTRNLLAMLNHSGLLHMIPSMVRSKYIIRFCVVAEHANEDDILHAWLTVKQQANELLPGVEKPLTPDNITRPPLTRQKSRAFSFTRSVSRELYKRSLSKGNLSDGATPILIPDDESNSPPGNEELLEEIVRAGRSDEEERQRRDGEQLAKELSECSVMDKQWLVDQV